MEEDIVRSWRNFCLIETEKEVVHFFTYDYEEFVGRERRTLIELVILDRAIDKKVFKSAIQSVWNLKGKVTIKEAVRTFLLLNSNKPYILKRSTMGGHGLLTKIYFVLPPLMAN